MNSMGFSIRHLFSFPRMKLGFAENVRSDGIIAASLRPDKRFKPRCSRCSNRANGVHSHHERSVRDLPLGPIKRVWVNYHYRKVECTTCGGFTVEDLGVADPGGPRVTRRFARYIFELCKLMPVKHVADWLDLDWKTVKAIDKLGLQDEFGQTDYAGLRYPAVDEISYKKHHHYLTIVLNFETGRVVWVGKGRKAETLDPFFSEMPGFVRSSIEAVAMDMWEPFMQAVQKWCPQAAIVHDPFHVIANYSRVIDQVRRDEVRKADSKESKQYIKGTRWILLKNAENLTENQVPRLHELLDANENLFKVYVLKDDLKAIWHHRDRVDMATALNDWCLRAREAALAPLDRFVDMLKAHADGILNHADHPIHTGRLEGMNNKIKVLKRQAYGFHDLEYFALKIKQRCSNEKTIHQRKRR